MESHFLDAEVALFVKNLTDKEYDIQATVFDNSLGYNVKYSGTPRTYGATFKVQFGGE